MSTMLSPSTLPVRPAKPLVRPADPRRKADSFELPKPEKDAPAAAARSHRREAGAAGGDRRSDTAQPSAHAQGVRDSHDEGVRAWGHPPRKDDSPSRADDAPRADRADEVRNTDQGPDKGDAAAQSCATASPDSAAPNKSEATPATEPAAASADTSPQDAQPQLVAQPQVTPPPILPTPLPVAVPPAVILPQAVVALAADAGGEGSAASPEQIGATTEPVLTSPVPPPSSGVADQTEAGEDLGKVSRKLPGKRDEAKEEKDAAAKKDAADAGEAFKAKDGDTKTASKEGEARTDIAVKDLLAKLEGAPAPLAHRHGAEANPLASLTAPSGPDAQAIGQAAAQTPALADPAASLRPTPLHAVPIEIGFKALAGHKSFDIRLDPADLGRIDVKLDFKDGEVSAKLTVDRVETLHLLQRDAKSLEHAFDQAGLKTSDGAINIQLRDRGADQNATPGRAWDDLPAQAGRGPAAPRTETTGPVPMQRRVIRLGGLDVSV